MANLEKLWEAGLWKSRLVVIVAVVFSLLCSLAIFYLASVDAFYMMAHLLHYASPDLDTAARAALRSDSIRHVVEVVDGYLLATVLLIFALGLYELFISKIDLAVGTDSASNVLYIKDLDDLKNRLAKVVMMILVVRYFEHAIGMTFSNPLDLLMFAAGIALLGLALYLSHLGAGKH